MRAQLGKDFNQVSDNELIGLMGASVSGGAPQILDNEGRTVRYVYHREQIIEPPPK